MLFYNILWTENYYIRLHSIGFYGFYFTKLAYYIAIWELFFKDLICCLKIVLFLLYAQNIFEEIISVCFVTQLHVGKKRAIFDRLVFTDDSNNFQL